MKEKRPYGLFEKKDEKWVRLFPTLQYRKSTAVRVFQDALLADPSRRELRPVKSEA